MVMGFGAPSSAAYGVRVQDLGILPTPPNPVRTWGRVTSLSPLTISDGQGEINVTGLAGLTVGDYLFVEGDWNGSVLSASQLPGKNSAYSAVARVEMMYVPAGSFWMGNNGSEPGSAADELPKHLVQLSGYWVGKFEVTRGEYRKFIDAGGYADSSYWSAAGWAWKLSKSRTQPAYWAADQDWGTGTFTQTDAHPVLGVSYHEAEAFCSWAGGHLPTEAQWEKAARWTGSTANVYPWDDVWGPEKCNNYYDHNAAGGGYQKFQSAPVGSYPSDISPNGCRDMAGNLSEWVMDWYADNYYSQTPAGGWADPIGPLTGASRIVRGGSWYISTPDYRSAKRYPLGVQVNWLYYGFRLAR